MDPLSRRSFHSVLGGAAVSAAFAPLSSGAAELGSSSVFPYGTYVYRESALPFDQLKA